MRLPLTRRRLIPGITTVETKHGVGAATWCKAKGKVISEIREGVKKAVAGQKKECQVALPEHFTYEVTYKDWQDPHQPRQHWRRRPGEGGGGCLPAEEHSHPHRCERRQSGKAYPCQIWETSCLIILLQCF